VTEGYREYARRMPPGTTLELLEVKAESRTGGKTVAQMLAAEAQRIRAALPKGGRLEDGAIWNGMCTHRVRLSSPKDLDKEVLGWLKKAYQQA